MYPSDRRKAPQFMAATRIGSNAALNLETDRHGIQLEIRRIRDR